MQPWAYGFNRITPYTDTPICVEAVLDMSGTVGIAVAMGLEHESLLYLRLCYSCHTILSWELVP